MSSPKDIHQLNEESEMNKISPPPSPELLSFPKIKIQTAASAAHRLKPPKPSRRKTGYSLSYPQTGNNHSVEGIELVNVQMSRNPYELNGCKSRKQKQNPEREEKREDEREEEREEECKEERDFELEREHEIEFPTPLKKTKVKQEYVEEIQSDVKQIRYKHNAEIIKQMQIQIQQIWQEWDEEIRRIEQNRIQQLRQYREKQEEFLTKMLRAQYF